MDTDESKVAPRNRLYEIQPSVRPREKLVALNAEQLQLPTDPRRFAPDFSAEGGHVPWPAKRACPRMHRAENSPRELTCGYTPLLWMALQRWVGSGTAGLPIRHCLGGHSALLWAYASVHAHRTAGNERSPSEYGNRGVRHFRRAHARESPCGFTEVSGSGCAVGVSNSHTVRYSDSAVPI